MQDDLKGLVGQLWRDQLKMKRQEEAAQDLRLLVDQLRARGFQPQVYCDPVTLELSLDVNLSDVRTADAPPFRSSRAGRDEQAADAAIEAHLNALGYAGGWSPQQDYHLAFDIAKGMSLREISAASLGRTSGILTDRYEALNQNLGDSVHAARLLRVLKRRAAALS